MELVSGKGQESELVSELALVKDPELASVWGSVSV